MTEKKNTGGLKVDIEGLSLAAQNQTLPPQRQTCNTIEKEVTNLTCKLREKFQETVEHAADGFSVLGPTEFTPTIEADSCIHPMGNLQTLHYPGCG